MNKFNVRISAIGGILLLVSIAFALAQHDSRRRSRKLDEAAQVPAQPAIPIAFETAEPDWHSAPPNPLVRGNNDELYPKEQAPLPPNMQLDPESEGSLPLLVGQLPTAPSFASQSQSAELTSVVLPSGDEFDNPLRESAQASEVVLAGGEQPVTTKAPGAPSPLPAGPPSWVTETLPQTASQAPPPNKQISIAGIPPLPNASQLPSTGAARPNSVTSLPPAGSPSAASAAPGLLPTFPISSNSPSAAPSSLPASNAMPAMPAPPANIPSSSTNGSSSPNLLGAPTNYPVPSDMSDTQRGVMSATAFPPAQSTQSPSTQPTPSNPASSAPQSPNGFPPNNFSNNNTQNGSIQNGSSTNQPNNALSSPTNRGTAFSNSSSSPLNSSMTNGMQGNGMQSTNTQGSSFQNTSSRTPAALTSLVSNEPGSRYLDGSQNPIMLIQKRGPEEVRVGKPATFVITVRNAGNSTAHDVTVVDSVPLGMRFNDANPPVSPTGDGILTWKLGEMPAGDERTINLQMIPERQGELGSVASVHFTAQASLRTVATQPKLEIQIDAQNESLIGDAQMIAVTVKNVGTGVARGVRLEADLPAQLRHESGDQHLEAIFPSELAPNQSQRIELRSMAAQPGDATCTIRALTEDGAEAQQQVPITVLSPALIAAIEGPRLRYLDRQATYKFKVQNNGTAAATNLKFTVRLPSGLRFNSSDNNLADYNPADHTVTLGLQELPVGTPAVFELTVLPVERGTQVLTLNANADLGISTEAKGQVAVEGLAELAFTIGQDNGTIETGSSSTYTVQVTNIGNNPDKDVRLAVQLPPGAQVMKVDAPVRYRAEGNQILFEPIAEMRNKDQHTFRFQVRHTQAGSMIVRTQLTSANWPVAVVKEEGTLVYNDQD